jgi:uncharacterized membrane protein HdeD (DUF308 family)
MVGGGSPLGQATGKHQILRALDTFLTDYVGRIIEYRNNMNTSPIPFRAQEALKKSRGWLIFFGMFSIVVGMFAIGFPLAMSVAIAQVIGIFCVASGVFSIGAVIFGKEKTHCITSVALAIIRLAAGLALLLWVESGVEALTLVLAIFFLFEGLSFIGAALASRQHGAWIIMLMNGIVAIILAAVIFSKLPGDSEWVLGLLYGINSIFYGVSLLALASGAPSRAAKQ